MTPEENFIELLKQNVAPTGIMPVVQAKVVEMTETTCKVRLANGNELDHVRYRATEDATKGFAIKPKKESNCLIGFVGSDINRPYLVATDEVEVFSIQIESEKVKFDKDGFDVKLDKGKLNASNAKASLKGVLQDVVAMVESITVSTGVGPSGTPLPPTITKANQIKTKISNLFK